MVGIVNNYSKAIFDIAQKHNILDEVKIQIENIAALSSEVKINRFFCSYAIDFLSKQKIIDVLKIQYDLNSIVTRFLEVTVKNNRFSFWPDIYRAFLKSFHAACNIMLVDVTSSKELTKDEKNIIINSLSDQYNKKIQAHFVVDETIVAGLIFNLTEYNEILDLSLKNYLNNIELRLKNYS